MKDKIQKLEPELKKLNCSILNVAPATQGRVNVTVALPPRTLDADTGESSDHKLTGEIMRLVNKHRIKCETHLFPGAGTSAAVVLRYCVDLDQPQASAPEDKQEDGKKQKEKTSAKDKKE